MKVISILDRFSNISIIALGLDYLLILRLSISSLKTNSHKMALKIVDTRPNLFIKPWIRRNNWARKILWFTPSYGRCY